MSPSTDILVLVALSIVRDAHPDWVTGTVAKRCRELGVNPERISRVKGSIQLAFARIVQRASQPGRRPFRPTAAIH